MKIVVDKIPETPRDCMFSERNYPHGFFCKLRPYIERAGCSPICLCKDTSKCDRLITLNSVRGVGYD